jgi:hypothetical protein
VAARTGYARQFLSQFGSTTPPDEPPATAKPADLNNDSRVNVADLSILLSSWGSTRADLNDDAATNIGDLSRLLTAWTG